jgi:hypothetical protein
MDSEMRHLFHFSFFFHLFWSFSLHLNPMYLNITCLVWSKYEIKTTTGDFRWESEIFGAQMTGGWLSLKPQIDTRMNDKADPVVAVLLAYLCTISFTPQVR